MLHERIAQIAFVVGLGFLAFCYGAASVKFHLPPYHTMVRIEAGVSALFKFDDQRMPPHFVREEPAATAPDPIEQLAPSDRDDLILMTGGFFYRMDLCPEFGCMAWIMDRSGKVVHTWQADPALLFTPEALGTFSGFPGSENIFVQGVALADDGSLVVTFQGRNIFPYQVGVARFAFDGRLEWIRINSSHHWPSLGADGRIYVPIAKIEPAGEKLAGTKQPVNCKFGAVFQEGAAILSPDGETLKAFWMEDVVRDSDRQGLIYSVRDDCDPFHVNEVTTLNAAAAAKIKGATAGDMLVSLRSSSSLVVMDPGNGRIKTILSGPMVAQHSPQVMPDGRIAVFDNLGGIDTAQGTRILALDPTGPLTTETLFPRDASAPGGDLDCKEEGSVRFSPDGARGLVAETLNGRVIEFDVATGKALWIYRSVSDMTPYLAKKGEEISGPTYAVLQAQGASFVSKADLTRWSAASP